MNLQPILENEIVLLRPLVKEDFENLYAAAKDPLIWEQHPCDRSNRNEFELFFEDALTSKGALMIIEKASGKIIGSSRFQKLDTTNNAIEIGWSFLSREYWGGKFNKIVKGLMIDYALKNVDTIVFYINKINIRSQKAVEKINGKRIEGIENHYLIHKNPDALTYLIIKKDRQT